MQYSIQEYKRCVVLATKERIDHYTAPELEKAFNEIIEAGHYRILFDMSAIDFISSAGWWVLINAQKTCKRYNRGEIVLVGAQPAIVETMEIIGIGEYFRRQSTLLEAIGNL